MSGLAAGASRDRDHRCLICLSGAAVCSAARPETISAVTQFLVSRVRLFRVGLAPSSDGGEAGKHPRRPAAGRAEAVDDRGRKSDAAAWIADRQAPKGTSDRGRQRPTAETASMIHAPKANAGSGHFRSDRGDRGGTFFELRPATITVGPRGSEGEGDLEPQSARPSDEGVPLGEGGHVPGRPLAHDVTAAAVPARRAGETVGPVRSGRPRRVAGWPRSRRSASPSVRAGRGGRTAPGRSGRR